MAKALKSLFTATSNILSGNITHLYSLPRSQANATKHTLQNLFGNRVAQTSRAHCTLSAGPSQLLTFKCQNLNKNARKFPVASFGTEVDREISKFLDKEIQYEKSRSSSNLPKITGFEISTNEADVTLTKQAGSEKIVIRLTVNGSVDSVLPDEQPGQSDEPPQMVCRPPFEVEISKGDGSVLTLQCTFPAADEMIEEGGQQANEQIDDQFEIQEIAIHGGEWKDATYSVSAATMDAELFDLLMDMLDERGINDEFIAHLVDYCTAYENQNYVNFLGSLKSFVEK